MLLSITNNIDSNKNNRLYQNYPGFFFLFKFNNNTCLSNSDSTLIRYRANAIAVAKVKCFA